MAERDESVEAEVGPGLRPISRQSSGHGVGTLDNECGSSSDSDHEDEDDVKPFRRRLSTARPAAVSMSWATLV